MRTRRDEALFRRHPDVPRETLDSSDVSAQVDGVRSWFLIADFWSPIAFFLITD
jgi:hypothetical protein